MAKRSPRVSVAGLALPFRVWAQRFAFLGLLALALALMLLSKADTGAIERVRIAIVDTIAPVMDVMGRPVQAAEEGLAAVNDFFLIHAENTRLREENERLMQWLQTARRLELENATLRAQLNYVPNTQPRYVTARVVADTAGVFYHSVLINAGKRHYVHRGQAVMAQGGVVGRIAEVGNRSARVLLLTDLNSRIPVVVDSTGDRAIVVGDNSPWPRLNYLPGNSPVSPGDRLLTSGHGGVFPPGLVVGTVAEVSETGVTVQPAVDLARLHQALVLDYGVEGILPAPEDAPAPPAGAR